MSHKVRCGECGHTVMSDFARGDTEGFCDCFKCGHNAWEQVEGEPEDKPKNDPKKRYRCQRCGWEVIREGCINVDCPKCWAKEWVEFPYIAKLAPSDEQFWVRITGCHPDNSSWYAGEIGKDYYVRDTFDCLYAVIGREGAPGEYIYSYDCERVDPPDYAPDTSCPNCADKDQKTGQLRNTLKYKREKALADEHAVFVKNNQVIDLEQSLGDTEAARDHYKGMTEHLRSVLNDKNKTIDSLEEKVEARGQIIRDRERTVYKELNDKDKQITDLEVLISNKDRTNALAEEAFAKADKEMDVLEEKVQELYGYNTSNINIKDKRLIEEQAEKIKGLEELVHNLQDNLMRGQRGRDEFKMSLEEMHRQLARKEEYIQTLIEEKGVRETSEKLKLQYIEELQAQICTGTFTYTQEVNEQAEKIKNLEQELTDKVDICEHLGKIVDGLECQNANLLRDFDRKGEKIEDLSDSRDILSKQVNEQAIKIENLTRELKAEREKQEYRVAYADAYAKAHDEFIEYVNQWEPGK